MNRSAGAITPERWGPTAHAPFLFSPGEFRVSVNIEVHGRRVRVVSHVMLWQERDEPWDDFRIRALDEMSRAVSNMMDRAM